MSARRRSPVQRVGGQRLSQPGHCALDPFNGGIQIPARPYGRDEEKLVGQPVEDENQRRPRENHVGEADGIGRRTRQMLDQADGFVSEITDEDRECGRQFGWNVEPAFGNQRAQCGDWFARCLKSVAIVRPVAIDLGLRAIGAKEEIGIEAEQAVAPARTPALYRFEKEVAAPGFDQLERCRNRGFGVRDDAAPDQRTASGGKRQARRRVGHCVPPARLRLTVDNLLASRLTPTCVRTAFMNC